MEWAGPPGALRLLSWSRAGARLAPAPAPPGLAWPAGRAAALRGSASPALVLHACSRPSAPPHVPRGSNRGLLPWGGGGDDTQTPELAGWRVCAFQVASAQPGPRRSGI